jgi:hypothetical protein
MEARLKANVEKTKYMLMCRHQYEEKNRKLIDSLKMWQS